MGEEFVFDGALMHIEGREKFLAGASAGGWPERAVTTLLAEAYDGEHAFQLYTASNGGTNVKIVRLSGDEPIVKIEYVLGCGHRRGQPAICSAS
jgi:hypothetical protein